MPNTNYKDEVIMSSLKNFLLRNDIPISKDMPLVHSTAAYYLKKIINSGKITPQPCDTFKNENLSYYFVGRPAYKKTNESETEYWELPCCIILDYKQINIKRLFPFDSGAFQKKVLPDFITMMDLNEFEASEVANNYNKIIGSFFLNNNNYYKLKPRDKNSFEDNFDINVLDEEIKALYKLILTKSPNFDDRRFSIEIQTEHSILLQDNVLAVVFPDIYMESDLFTNKMRQLGATLIPYETFPINQNYYYGIIYDKVFQFYKNSNYLD